MTTPLFSGTWNESATTETYVNSTNVITTTMDWRDHPLNRTSEKMRLYILPVIILSGLFGNVMTIIIMRRMKSGEGTINMYFTAVAVLDLLYLCTNSLVVWMLMCFDFYLTSLHNVICKLFIWTYTGGGTISAWYLVCMTVQRALSVVWPHRVNLLCTRRTVLLLQAGIALFFGILYSHYLVGFELILYPNAKRYVCTVRYFDEEYLFFIEKIFTYIEVSIYSIIPFICMAVSNSVLIWKLSRSVAAAAGEQLSQGNSEQVQAREKAARSVTVTVIVVSVTFIILTLPVSIDYIVLYFKSADKTFGGIERARLSFINAVVTLLADSNSAINFYLYILTGSRFREEFIKLMCCSKKRRHK